MIEDKIKNSHDKYAVSREIEKILKRYLDDNQRGKGSISLLPAPTGSGKSYTVAKVTSEYISNKSFNKKIIYIVNTIENLRNQYEDTLSHAPEMKEKILLLKNDSDMLFDFFDSKKDISEFAEFDEYKALKEIVGTALEIKKQNQNNSIVTDGIKKTMEESKRVFQKRLRREYKSLESTHKKDIFKCKVAKIFPAVLLKKYEAIFLTTHKLLYPIWTLSGSDYLYNFQEMKGSILFIDEFDAQKNIILDKLVEDAASKEVDKISFFINAHLVISSGNFLKKYGIDDKHIDYVKQKFEEVYNEYMGGLSFVYVSEEKPNIYMVNSAIGITVEQGQKRLTIEKDRKNLRNWIEEGSDYKFRDMIGKVDRGIRDLAGIGKKTIGLLREERKNREDKEWCDWIEEKNSLLRQFIGEFNLVYNDVNYKYFENVIESGFEGNDFSLFPSIQEEFYDHGLSLMNVEHTSKEAKRSSFSFYELARTPENLLVTIAQKMNVVGISATATIKTVIKNFDLDYLEQKNTVAYPTKPEIENINNLYIVGKRQENRNFYVEFIENKIDTEEIVNKYFGGNIKAKVYIDDLFKDIQEHCKERYKRLISSYWEFITNESIKSFLVLLNKYPKGDNDSFRESTINDIFYMMIQTNREHNRLDPFIAKKYEKTGNDHDNKTFFVARSDNFNKKKFNEDIQKDILGNGRKVFVIGTYQGMGIGRNIHYEVNGREKDYDAIFCEKPTNLLVRYEDKKKENGKMISMLKLLYQLHALYASMTIDKKELKKYLNWAVSGEWLRIGYNKGDDYNNAAMIMLIQAIGRLHRVNSPDDPMFIFIDDHYLDIIRSFDEGGHSVLPSIRKVLDKARDGISKEARKVNALGINKTISDRNEYYRNKINSLKKRLSKNPKASKEYKNLREILLANPTVSKENTKYNGLYTPILNKYDSHYKYWYKQSRDYEEIEVSQKERKSSVGFIEVSEKGARLDILKRIRRLKNYLEGIGVNLAFDNSRMMIPIAYNNLYKGILGEVVGKWLVEKMCGVALEDLNPESGHYEFFDFKVADKNIYVDFKYYSDAYAREKDFQELIYGKEGKVGAIRKKEEVNADKVVIINIMTNANNISKKIEQEGGVYVVPYLIDSSSLESPFIDLEMVGKLRGIFL